MGRCGAGAGRQTGQFLRRHFRRGVLIAIDVREVPAQSLQAALTVASIPVTWSVAAHIHSLAGTDIGLSGVTRTTQVRDGFRNQLVGRIAEVQFEDNHLASLKSHGFEWRSHYAKGDNRDYSVTHPKTTAELSINVKTASTLFRNAMSVVKLEPTDCVPISVYKALGGSKSWPDLIYADLVDFNLRQRADDFVSGLGGDEELLWDMFSWYGGKGAKTAEDAYTKWIHGRHKTRLQGLIDPACEFRVISAKRAIAIQHAIPRRCPGLGIKGGFGEVNVHVSVSREMTPWKNVESILISGGGIDEIHRLVMNQVTRSVPEPLL